jgi:hypothetical protein
MSICGKLRRSPDLDKLARAFNISPEMQPGTPIKLAVNDIVSFVASPLTVFFDNAFISAIVNNTQKN